ncbi:flagellar hook assembly protein FlgD [Novosphingobium beihaiensis]|uniref:Basal-body rod modification protein FlgD n=1 Tax=Novosphingobium beihaiensis TaxID=2930389 RepID=A0ABT0BPI1_9SPHN|nr:flagellar hook capping FlgD N-terminal domain-containing protein [Novosphingobium beihaiensis]MCJ2186985.1 flagellar hook capping protein [Novosphingobium beihaiensis]
MLLSGINSVQPSGLGRIPIARQISAGTTGTTTVGAGTSGTTTTPASTATSAFGLGFDALLKIVLTQLTYQDPLKPMDNFQFVSQLAQFSQIQQGQETNQSLSSLLAAQAASQASGLLGRTVDVNTGQAQLTGVVKAVSFANGSPALTIQTPEGATVSSIALATVTQVRETQ